MSEFDSPGVPLTEWIEKTNEIGSELNCHIVSSYEGKRRNRIIVETVPYSQLPDCIDWKDEYLSPDDFVLQLGIGYAGIVSYNMAKIPHALIGGSSGSGKTALMKGMIYQCKRKDAAVFIADLKGGMDYPTEWKKSNFADDKESTLDLLTMLSEELEDRKRLYNEYGVERYSKDATGLPATRLVFACDEVSELLDKAGLDTAGKQQVSQIEGLLSSIARQGRAFGIHLLLGTQRPDADVLKGQIKNNIGFPVCGRADSTLSKIVLDSPIASTVIPKDAQGRFVLNDGQVFQAFNFENL